MKKIVLIAAGLVCSGAAFCQQTVSGKIKGGNGKTIYLYNDKSNTPEDSVALKADESFSMPVKGKDKAIYALILQDNDQPMLFTSGKENVVVNAAVSTFPVAQSFKGDEDAKAMQAYQQAFQPLIGKAQELNVEARGIRGDDEAAKEAFRKKADAFGAEVTKTGVAFVEKHPHNLASVWLMLNELRNRVDPQQMEQLFTSLDKPLQQSKYGEAIGQYLHAARLNGIGIEADDFTQNDVTGKPVSLKSFRGKYVLVDFWASWCGPCRAENPNVVAAYNKFKDKNFTILGISLDKDKNPWTHAIEKDGLAWTQVSDLKGWENAVAVQYGIQSIPANMLVGPDGKIVARNLRGEALEAKLDELLNK